MPPAAAVDGEAEDGGDVLHRGLRRQKPPVRGDQAVDEAEDIEEGDELQQ